MLVQLECVELALICIPVGTDPFEGGRPIEEGVRHHVDLRICERAEPSLKICECSLRLVRHLSLLARKVLGGTCAAL